MSWQRPLRWFGNFRRKTDANSRSRRPGLTPMWHRLHTEPLEERCMLAAVTVDNDLDSVNGDTSSVLDLITNNGGDGISLREALEAANNTVGMDTIDFDAALSGNTIVLGGTQLSISDDVMLMGLGANQLTINAGGASRVMIVTSNAVAEISGLTLTGGSADRGGGLRNYAGSTTTLSGVVIQGNTATLTGTATVHDAGGGVWNSGDLTVNDSVITGNMAPNASAYGGGFWNNNVLAISRSTISSNMATDGGGMYNATGSNLTITDSTISGNTATDDAGGIWAYGTLLISGSTISGNTSTDVGGGLMIFTDTTMIRYSTITGNQAERGAGIRAYSDTVDLSHTIVANNIATTSGNDIEGTITANFSLIEDVIDATIGGANNILGLDPVLGPLANTGGPTETHALLPGSPAIDAGDPAAMAGVGDVPMHDQRGTGFPRIFAVAIDIGSTEKISETFIVDTAVDESDGDLSLGDLSFREALELANANPGVDAVSFDAALAGSTINLTGTPLLITDDVSVTGLGADQITIDAQGMSGVMIVDVSATVEISGLTFSGGSAARGGGLRNYTGSTTTLSDVVIQGNTATTTSSDAGGGIWNAGVLTVNDSLITGNMASSSNAYGGGLWNGNVLSISRSTISLNRARDGGGVFTGIGTVLTITDSTISLNTATDQGGGVFSVANDPTGEAATTITGSTISGNTANFGGGVYNFAGLVVINHSTITLNTATADGGGVADRGTSAGRILVGSSIIAGNTDDDDVHFGSDVNAFFSFDFNIIGGGSASGAFVEPGDRVDVFDPVLSPLGDNGGPTFTHALLLRSPAINAGDPAAVAGVDDVPLYDQRGAPYDRVVGIRIDSGAVESDTVSFPGDGNLDGMVDGLDYILWASFYSDVAQDPPGSPENGDYNNDGVVDGLDYLVWALNFGTGVPAVASSQSLAPATLSTSARLAAVDAAFDDTTFDDDEKDATADDLIAARWRVSLAFGDVHEDADAVPQRLIKKDPRRR